jgi:hypothetical protein
MNDSARRSPLMAKIRTLWFLTAMIPVALVALLLGILTLIVTLPLIIFAALTGKHLKDPRKRSFGDPLDDDPRN